MNEKELDAHSSEHAVGYCTCPCLWIVESLDKENIHEAVMKQLELLSGSDGDMCMQDWGQENTEALMNALGLY